MATSDVIEVKRNNSGYSGNVQVENSYSGYPNDAVYIYMERNASYTSIWLTEDEALQLCASIFNVLNERQESNE